MLWDLRVLVLAGALLLVAPGLGAGQVEELTWDSLLPAEATAIRTELQAIQVRMRKLSAEERAAIPRIAAERSLRARIENWNLPEARLTASERQVLEASPSRAYPAANALWEDLSTAKQRLHALEGNVNEPLDGHRIRLSGFLLPLEFDGRAARTFLLVPFVGACIHVPPPPPNQIVHVTSDSGYRLDENFEAVTVTGVLKAQSGRYDLFLEDGEAPVDAGYRLQAESIAPVESTRL